MNKVGSETIYAGTQHMLYHWRVHRGRGSFSCCQHCSVELAIRSESDASINRRHYLVACGGFHAEKVDVNSRTLEISRLPIYIRLHPANMVKKFIDDENSHGKFPQWTPLQAHSLNRGTFHFPKDLLS
jgi:hypothetical protein